MGTKTKSSGNDASVDVDMVDNPAVSVMNSYWNSKLGTTNVWATGYSRSGVSGHDDRRLETWLQLDGTFVVRLFRKEFST